MVVLAASICTKTGKAVLSRQFVEMPRSRIEGLLASFPKLIGNGDQHTYVETDSVRYVYQPLEDLFMVLVTNKHSNIRQDIDTLQLFARVVAEYCRSSDEREIVKQSFDLLLIFDEIISMGYRENVNLGQIRTIATMESHDERIQAEIEKNKEKEANEERKRKAKMMDMQKREMAKKGFGNQPGSGGFSGSSGGYGGNSSFGSYGAPGGGSNTVPGGYSSGSFSTKPPATSGGFGTGPSSSFGGSGGYGGNANSSSLSSSGSGPAQQASRPGGGRGMQLGGKVRQNSLIESIKADEGIQEHIPVQASAQPMSQSASSEAHRPATRPHVHEESVHIVLEEKISLVTKSDGALQNFDVNGSLVLKINDASSDRIKVQMNCPPNNPNLQFKTHPNVDRNLWASSNAITMRDPSKPFPVGQPLPLVKWRYSSKNESDIPLTVSCWPSPSGGNCDVNVEFELQNTSLELHDVTIIIPYPGGTPPTIGEIEGHYQINPSRRHIVWTLPVIDANNASGMLEFNVASEDVSGFYPIEISFSSTSTLLNPITVGDVALLAGGNASFSSETTLLTDVYQVLN